MENRQEKHCKIDQKYLLWGCEELPEENGGPGIELLKELEPIGP